MAKTVSKAGTTKKTVVVKLDNQDKNPAQDDVISVKEATSGAKIIIAEQEEQEITSKFSPEEEAKMAAPSEEEKTEPPEKEGPSESIAPPTVIPQPTPLGEVTSGYDTTTFEPKFEGPREAIRAGVSADIPIVTIGDASAPEGEPLIFAVNLSNPSYEAITLNLAAGTPGTATPTVDYETLNFRYSTNGGTTWIAGGGINGTEVTFAAGTTSLLVEVDTVEDTEYELDETMTLSVASVVSGGVGDTSDIGTGTILNDDEEIEPPSLRGVLVVNEVGLNVPEVTFTYKDQGQDITVTKENISYFEIRNIEESSAAITQAWGALSIEFIDMNGVKQTLNLYPENFDKFSGSKPAAKEYFVVFEDGTWAQFDQNGGVDTYGRWDESTENDGLVNNWQLDTNTSQPIAVNLVQRTNIGTSQDPNYVFQTVDALVANGISDTTEYPAFATLTGYNQLWEGPDFDGSLTENMVIFSRVFSSAPSGVSAHTEPYPNVENDQGILVPQDMDTNTSADWTVNNETNSVGWLNRTGPDLNPEDITDDLDPRQASGQPDDSGQTYVEGTSADETIYGGRGPDVLFGGEGDDTILGGDHNDFIDGGPGADTIDGGSGSDTIILEAGSGLADTSVDGGTGVDTGKFAEGEETLDLSGGGELPGIEIIDMKDALSADDDNLVLTKANIITLGDNNTAGSVSVTSDTSGYAGSVDVYVKGDSGDTVSISDEISWSNSGTIVWDGTTYDVYVNNDGGQAAVIAIEDGVIPDFDITP